MAKIQSEKERNKYFIGMNLKRKELEKEKEDKVKVEKECTTALIKATMSQERVRFLNDEVKNFKAMFHQQRGSNKQLEMYKEKMEKDAHLCAKKTTEINCLKSRLLEKDLLIEKLRAEVRAMLEKQSIRAKQLDSKKNTDEPALQKVLLEEYKSRLTDKDKQITDLMKRFKKYNLAEKRGVLQLKEFNKKEEQYEQLIRALKRKLVRYEAASNLDNSSESSEEEAGKSESEGFVGSESDDSSKRFPHSPEMSKLQRIKDRGVVLRATVMSTKSADGHKHRLKDALNNRHSFDQKRKLIKGLTKRGLS